jgi:pyridoxal phosphate enzyme (YggS family)
VNNELNKVITQLRKEVGNKTLLAVSKMKSNEEILKVYELGIRDFGENYVQELINKMDLLPKDIKWHMIGHLQTNKVKDIVKRNIYLIESVDSIKLVEKINKEAIINNKVVNILIEVNIANDINKTGCSVSDLDFLIKKAQTLSNVNLLGLMAIAPHTEDINLIRDAFKKMKKLKNKYQLELLSMGMSSDYLIALEEGSDIVRIGTKIFGERIKTML